MLPKGSLVWPLPPYGPNNQLSTIMEVASVAATLNATLVLPRLRRHHTDHLSETLEFEQAYSIGRWSSHVGLSTISVANAAAIRRRALSGIGARRRVLFLQLDGGRAPNDESLRTVSEVALLGIRWSSLRHGDHHRIASRDLATSYQLRMRLAAAISSRGEPPSMPCDVFVSGFSSLPNLPARPLWATLDFAPRIRLLAARAVRTAFGSADQASSGSSGSAGTVRTVVHVRRADADSDLLGCRGLGADIASPLCPSGGNVPPANTLSTAQLAAAIGAVDDTMREKAARLASEINREDGPAKGADALAALAASAPPPKYPEVRRRQSFTAMGVGSQLNLTASL